MGNISVIPNSITDEPIQKSTKYIPQNNLSSLPNFRVLLLGAGFSGKSTTFFQAQTLFEKQIISNSVKGELSKMNIMKVRYNCMQLIKNLIDNVPNPSKEAITLHNLVAGANLGGLSQEKTDLTSTFDLIIKYLSSEQGKEACELFKKSPSYYDGAERFLDIDNLKKIQHKDYTVDQNDFLCTRIKTTGIISFRFLYESKVEFQITDVGGQRSERRKWVNAFKETHCVVYIISLSEYDEINYEDEVTNRMVESINVFDQTIHGEWFREVPFIIFWNKRAVLESKIKSSPLSKLFPEYKGGDDSEQAFEFIKSVYLSKCKRDLSKFKHVVGNAFDMTIIEKIFDEIKELEEAKKLL